MSDKLLTAEQVSELLNVPVSWVREHTRNGRIPHVPLGRYRRYRESTVLDWLTGIETEGRDALGFRTYMPSRGDR